MTIRIFVPRDSTALALGADEVASAIAAEAARRHLDVEIVRNGTRGLLWLEPLVEVETPAGRVGFSPVDCADVAALFDANFHLGECRHALALGLVEQIAYLARQTRLTFARTGIIDPVSLTDYEAYDGATATSGG
jgi:formate dehydrogenase iron-sulfur subunit